MSAPSSPLVSATWLAQHLDDPRVRIADVRWYLGGKRGEDAYAAGHIPGAVFVDLDRDLASPPTAISGRHPLPDAHDFTSFLARIGVEADTIVVAYDDVGGAIAARLWWLLRHFGHAGGRVLDGGLQAFAALGHALSTEVPTFSRAEPIELSAGGAGIVDKATVNRVRNAPRTRLLDARSSERFEGRSEPIDARPGHIPGAISAPFVDNLVAPGGVMRSPDELAARYRALGAFDAEQVIASCGSGVTACHTLLALAIAGRDDALLYEGSWSEWARDPSLPVETGAVTASR